MKINDLPANRASFRISLIIGLVMVLCILAEGVLSLIVYRNDTIETQATRAKTIASTVASAFRDPDRLMEAYYSSSENEYWKEMKSYLDEVKIQTGVTYLYILDARLDDHVYYIMEGALPGEDVPAIGDTDNAEDFAADELTETLRSGAVTSGLYDSAEYGVFVFSYAAITGSDGRPAAIVGADIHIGYVTAASTRFVARTAVFSLAFCVLLSLFVRWYIRRNVGSPLERAAQLQEAHDRVKVFLDAMPFPCRLWDRDHKVIDCNDEAVRFYGLSSKEEMIARYAELYPEYQSDGQLTTDKLDWTLNKAFDEGMYTYEATHLMPDGTIIPVESILVRVKYGDDYVLACYTRDLSEHKKMMAEIERSASLLNTVNSTANILLQSESEDFEHDLHNCMGMIGKAVGVDRVCMWKNHTIDGKLFCDLLYDWPGGEGSLIDKDVSVNVSYSDNTPGWEEILSHGNCINTSVSRLSPEEQAQLQAHGVKSLFVAPVFVRGNFWGYVGFDDFHTENIRTEYEASTLRSGSLLIANALLRNDMLRNLKTAAAELETALNAANNANQAKSDFLAHMSHEMRTPLNAIIGLSDLVLGTEDLNDECTSNLEKINNAGITLLGTVNDILDIAKIEAGKFELVPVEYDTPSLINDTVSQNILRIGEKPVQFILHIDSDFPATLYGDEIRVRQMLSNLLSNAFKYTQQGTVELSVSSAREGDDVRITAAISDTGIGIKPEDIVKLFGAYAQVDSAVNRDIEGTGLGLQITRRMAEVMKGAVSVKSEYGKGSTFTVTFLQKSVSDAVIGPETSGALMRFLYSDYKRRSNMLFTRVSMPYARVLVVDDVPTNLDVARGLMKPYNMQVDCVASGQEAIDAIRAGAPRYDAVFMDHMMPEMNGVEATLAIREIGTEYAANVPIIALTANAILGYEDMFLSEGFQAFISKPIEIMRLDEVLRTWVRNDELEKQYQKLLSEKKSQNTRSNPDRRSGIDRRALSLGIEGVLISKGIERFGSKEAYFDIVRSFALNTPPLLEKLRHVSKSGLDDYVIIVHGVKGSARGIGADAFADIAEALEKAARSGDYDYVETHNARLLDAGWKLLSDIEEMLTLIAQNEQKPGAKSPGRDEGAERKRIILVDDNLTSLEMGRKMLGDHYQVIPAVSAGQMFEILEKVTPDLILLDVEMPEMNGYHAIRLLKSNPLYAGIPVIFLTGRNEETNEQEGLALGAVDYVYKPYTAMLLHNRIENHLKTSR